MKDILAGKSTAAHQVGTNEADSSANEGSRMIALPELLFKGHLLKRHIVVALQAMYLACYNRRQTMALEAAVERELEGEPAPEES